MANIFKPLTDFSNTRILFRRPLYSYSKVQALWGLIIRNKRFQLKRYNMEGIYCNVGCGLNVVSGFLNIDYNWKPGVDLCWDITKGLPFEDESIGGIFIEHFLEHFSTDESLKLLREFHRVLKKGRILRVIVPDGEFYVNLYIKSKSDKGMRFPYLKYHADKTGISYLNEAFRMHGHKFIYDEEALSKLLLMSGFKEPGKKSFMEGEDKKLLIDQEFRRYESLYMEATK